MKPHSIPQRTWVLLDRFGRIIEIASGTVCVILLAGLFATTLLGVFFRYIMTSPFEWTEEMARFLMLGTGFLGINIALRHDAHIKIDLVVKMLPNKVSKFLDYFIAALLAFFLMMLMWKGYLMTTRTMMTGAALPISMFWPYLAVPLGALLTIMQLLLNTAKKVIADIEPSEKAT
jgi:TRAP-type C4-dicarboxylate transport system permease small subunit